MTTITLSRAVVEQALEALENLQPIIGNGLLDKRQLAFIDPHLDVAMTALRAALAQQAEPDHETRAELAEQQVVQLAEERDHYRNLWQKARQAESVEPVASKRDTVCALCAREIALEAEAAPFGCVTVRRLSLRHENHADQYQFYPAGQSPYLDNVDECHTVYTAPPQRKPLTVEEILRVKGQFRGTMNAQFVDFARAVERAHGIPMPEAPACPDCHGIGYDASGQTCACQENPSF